MVSRIVMALTGIGSLFIVFLTAYSAAFALLAPASVSLNRFSTFGLLAAIVGSVVYVIALFFFLIWPSRTSNYVQYFLVVYALLATLLSGFQIVTAAIPNWSR